MGTNFYIFNLYQLLIMTEGKRSIINGNLKTIKILFQLCEFYFEDFFKLFTFANYFTVAIAQLVRASDCGSEGRGFEPHWSPFKCFSLRGI